MNGVNTIDDLCHRPTDSLNDRYYALLIAGLLVT